MRGSWAGQEVRKFDAGDDQQNWVVDIQQQWKRYGKALV